MPGCIFRTEAGGYAEGCTEFSSAIGSVCLYFSALTVQPAWLPSVKSLFFLFCIKLLLSICLFLSRKKERHRERIPNLGGDLSSSPLQAGLALFLLVIIEYDIEKDSCTCHGMLPRGGNSRGQVHVNLSCAILIEENYMENKWGSAALLHGRSSEMKLVFSMIIRK